MSYFVTGATGLVGQQLLRRLLAREGTLYCLVKDDQAEQRLRKSASELAALDRVLPIRGNLNDPALGLCPRDTESLRGKIVHFVHLASHSDFRRNGHELVKANVTATEHALACAELLGATCFHHLSSIAAAGLYRGCFDEQMFAEAEQLTHPYFLSRHLCEKAVREHNGLPYRIYRPGIVIGDSETGAANRVQGPYYFFKLLQKVRDALPRWFPLAGFEGGPLNIVPVDYVADAFDCLMHLADQDGECFHLTDPRPYHAGEVLNIISRAGRGPTMTLKMNMNLTSLLPQPWLQLASQYPPLVKLGQRILSDYGIPPDLMALLNYPTRFDNQKTRTLLDAHQIRCPDLASYANRLWDYWERELDPDLFLDDELNHRLQHKTVLITGASSGIGEASAERLAASGAHLLLVGRDKQRLQQVQQKVRERGGKAQCYLCDLTDEAQTDTLVQTLLSRHGKVDVMINCAGRSIRRSVAASVERIHDYQRTMAINYFGALRLILGLIGPMAEQQKGHIIIVSSIGVLTNAPRFSAYVASNAALESFCRCAAAEYSDSGVRFTTINMPLVDTPMSAPTQLYQAVPTLSSEQAAELIAQAVVHRPKRIATKLGIFGAVLHALSPRLAEISMNMLFRMFPESGEVHEDKLNYTEQQQMIGLAAMLRGIHF
ncbi:SDR family oxidoreductase [Ferrimonas sp. SCSIO 43195]|uniref:SDR family oxidoreductase n=1 Tax=Ferrimonas sp. SCSIO 43195 TaxID=2822844 RepID=UPI00207653D6|nr:SDR family oxidoreductase [Ferrimonas sp. SCSIO 43195]USD39519.1 SDR family oxidoreductase [Ferrimonas sp. SCSIO 43195]